jgi:hypothetical protein
MNTGKDIEHDRRVARLQVLRQMMELWTKGRLQLSEIENKIVAVSMAITENRLDQI